MKVPRHVFDSLDAARITRKISFGAEERFPRLARDGLDGGPRIPDVEASAARFSDRSSSANIPTAKLLTDPQVNAPCRSR